MTYPTIRPELTLDFANSRQLDPRITFSRSSSATYLNPDTGLITTASDHEARFEEGGLLIEESRTNIVSNSTDLSALPNETLNLNSFSSSTDSPIDGMLSWRVRPQSVNSNQIGKALVINRATRFPTGLDRTYSVFVKNNGGTKVGLDYGNSTASNSRYFEFATEQFKFFQNDSVTTDDIGFEKYSNGWYRIFLINTVIADSGLFAVGGNYFHPNTEGDVDVLVCAPQAEDGLFPTSCIPTAGSTVTRSADTAQVGGDNFSSWYNQSEGTIYAKFAGQTYATGSDTRILSFADRNATRAGARPGILFGSSTGADQQMWRVRGSPTTSFSIATAPVVSTALAYATSDLAMVFDGGTVESSTNPPSTGLNRLNIFPANAPISRLSYYSRRLSNAELQTITL